MPFDLEPLRADQLAELHALIRRCEVFDQIPYVSPREEIEEWADDPHIELTRDGRSVWDDGKMVGWALIFHTPGEADHARAFLAGEVDPEFRRQGLGSRIMEWSIERARERLHETSPNIPRFVRTAVYDYQEDCIALYERHGLKPVRFFTELLQPLDSAPQWSNPDGVEIVPWSDERSEEARLLFNLAFQDHWGSTPVDEAGWNHRLAGVGTRTDLSFLALAGGEVVAAVLNSHYPADQEVTGRLDGVIATLGTHPDHRQRGIASALIRRSLAAFAEAGFDHSIIGVDSDSQTGANRLYENLGFRPLHRLVQHQIEV
jgi:ribosomal protein S18 acetylase RimI-like enzyme